VSRAALSLAALPLAGLALLAACSGGGEGNQAGNDANEAAAEGEDLNMAISGDELSPIPEAEDDMIANNSSGANIAGNAANAAAPTPQPAPAPAPAPAPPRR
jgi:hypothetical protein